MLLENKMGASSSKTKSRDKIIIKDPKKYKVMKFLPNDTYDLVIYGTMLLIFLLVSLYYIKNISTDKYTNTAYSVDLTSRGQKSIYKFDYDTCPTGYCAQARDSGIKRCPEKTTDILVFDSSLEVCTPSDSCLALPYIYPIKSDGGTVVGSKNCIQGSSCRCSAQTFCSDYVSSIFDGDSLTDDQSFTQPPINTREPMENIQYDDLSQRCIISAGYTNRILKGCDFSVDMGDTLNSLLPTDNYNGSTANYKNMLLCVAKNPCDLGQFAYNSDSLSYYDSEGGYRKFMQFISTSEKPYTSYSPTDLSLIDFINEPALYTLSCVYGRPCYGEDDPDKTRFYPYYDENLYRGNNNEAISSGTNNTNLSLYYPIWSNNRRRIECVRMYPLFIFDVVLDGISKTITEVNITASGRDYDHYLLGTDNKFYYPSQTDSNPGVLEVLFFDSIDDSLINGIKGYISNITNGKLAAVTLVTTSTYILRGSIYALLTGFASPTV